MRILRTVVVLPRVTLPSDLNSPCKFFLFLFLITLIWLEVCTHSAGLHPLVVLHSWNFHVITNESQWIIVGVLIYKFLWNSPCPLVKIWFGLCDSFLWMKIWMDYVKLLLFLIIFLLLMLFLQVLVNDWLAIGSSLCTTENILGTD